MELIDLLEYLTFDPPTEASEEWHVTEDMIKPDTPPEIRQEILRIISD